MSKTRTIRYKKPTYEELAQKLDRSERENTRYMQIMNDLFNGKVEAQRVAKHEGDKYTFSLFRSASPSGGYVAMTFHHEGQSDYTVLYDAPEFFTGYGKQWPQDMWNAIQGLWSVYQLNSAA